MARRGRTVIPEEDTELNMTPMLDVVFILLIFFIVTSRPIVQSILAESPKAEAIIKADKDAEVGVVMAVQELMQDLKINARVGTE